MNNSLLAALMFTTVVTYGEPFDTETELHEFPPHRSTFCTRNRYHRRTRETMSEKTNLPLQVQCCGWCAGPSGILVPAQFSSGTAMSLDESGWSTCSSTSSYHQRGSVSSPIARCSSRSALAVCFRANFVLFLHAREPGGFNVDNSWLLGVHSSIRGPSSGS